MFNFQDMLDKCLLPNANEPDVKAFFLKLKADYYRYLVEVSSGEEKCGPFLICN